MNHEIAKLREADGIEVITLVDNYADALLDTTEIMSRPSLAKEGVIQANTSNVQHTIGSPSWLASGKGGDIQGEHLCSGLTTGGS